MWEQGTIGNINLMMIGPSTGRPNKVILADRIMKPSSGGCEAVLMMRHFPLWLNKDNLYFQMKNECRKCWKWSVVPMDTNTSKTSYLLKLPGLGGKKSSHFVTYN